MKIYFTASTSTNGTYKKQYESIISYLEKKGHTIVSGKQILSPKKLSADHKRGSKAIFQREKDLIEQSDCVIAEVTKPSTGVGGEIVYALLHDTPVLALFYEDAEDQLSPMIEGNPSEHLYLEHYSDQNISLVLKNFVSHIEKNKKRKGKLIVIDGGDGSGKTTQAKKLIEHLQVQGIPVKYMDFPQYYTSFHGRLVGRFLSGEFGGLDDVSPYLASLAYALDRASAKEEMDQWLEKGGYIISNRYVTSSMAHQGARLPEKERARFIRWIDELEYRQHKMPRPDIVVYLYVPWNIGMELTSKKADKRKYTKGADIAEADVNHRKQAEKMYLMLADKNNKWERINCVEHGTIRSVDNIQKELLSCLKENKLV